MQCSISGPARRAIGTSKLASRRCSFAMRSLRVGPAVFGRHGSPHSVLSKWTWLSTKAGRIICPAPSTRTGRFAGAPPAGTTDAIVAPSTITSTAALSGLRTLRTTCAAMIFLRDLVDGRRLGPAVAAAQREAVARTNVEARAETGDRKEVLQPHAVALEVDQVIPRVQPQHAPDEH